MTLNVTKKKIEKVLELFNHPQTRKIRTNRGKKRRRINKSYNRRNGRKNLATSTLKKRGRQRHHPYVGGGGSKDNDDGIETNDDRLETNDSNQQQDLKTPKKENTTPNVTKTEETKSKEIDTSEMLKVALASNYFTQYGILSGMLKMNQEKDKNKFDVMKFVQDPKLYAEFCNKMGFQFAEQKEEKGQTEETLQEQSVPEN